MKSLLAPMTRISNVRSVTEGTGNDALSFLKSNSGNFELSFIRFWYLRTSSSSICDEKNVSLQRGNEFAYAFAAKLSVTLIAAIGLVKR